MLSKRPVLASFALLAALAGYMVLFPPQEIAGTQLASCPMELAGYPGTELGMDQTVLDDLNPDDYLIRRYDRPDGKPIWVVIVFFQNARLGAHDPELCYRSQGFRVHSRPEGRMEVPGHPLLYQTFEAEKGTRRELVRYFWYTAGERTMADVKGWRDSMFFQGLRSNRSFGAFVRVSTLMGGSPEEAEASVENILRDLAPLLPRLFPEDKEGDQG